MQTKQLECIVEMCSIGQQSSTIRGGDFFLVHGDNSFSKLIQLGQTLRFHGADKQYAYWTHTGMFLNNSGDIIEADGMGVTENNISYYKDQKYIIVHVSMSEEDREEVVDFAKSCLGEQYGWVTILAIGISLLTGLKFSFGFSAQAICSGLVTRALERSSFIPNRDPESAMPADLAKWFNVS